MAASTATLFAISTITSALKEPAFFSNAFDLCPVCVCSDILKKAMSGRGQFPDVDTVLFRVRTGAKSDKPSFGAVFHGIKNIIIVEFSFKLNLISRRINGFFTKHIKNISPCITNEVAVVVKICVFFNAEHNSPHTIHAQLHTNPSFQHHKPVRSSTRRAFRFCDYFSFGFSESGGALRLRMICGASGAAPCSLAYRAISSGSPTGKPFSSSGPS